MLTKDVKGEIYPVFDLMQQSLVAVLHDEGLDDKQGVQSDFLACFGCKKKYKGPDTIIIKMF